MLRELIIEHLFIGEALRKLWQFGITDVEILRSESDSFGYDLVMSRGDIVRHVQLKTRKVDGASSEVKISLRLMEKPSGCVICINGDSALNLESFLWFGGAPGAPLPDITHQKVAKHTKGDAGGKKAERPNHRVLKRSNFVKLKMIDEVLLTPPLASRMVHHTPGLSAN
jgi:hypothetical protein